LIDGRLVVVDLKTPAAESKTWRLQLAAYHHLVKSDFEKRGLEVELECMSLRLKKTGGEAKAHVYIATPQDFAVYLSCLNVHRYFNS
jgi:hypothetical protein